MVVLEIPSDYGYVLLAAASSTFVNMWHSSRVSKFRYASGVAYPNAYASAEEAKEGTLAYRFNCAQRAHSNFTENLTPFLASLLIAGLRFPLVSAGLGFGWFVGRIMYTVGYVGSGPKGRVAGAIVHNLCNLALSFTGAYAAFTLIQGQ
ncbi:Microsomal glutathione S-transferase 3 [Cytospora mali]|uniref:Microsomal glutathione S-transferase 3 n=1 Tax=Cytospora mali TaxID=578113 RepID=A0A194V4L7_CYTMA|nr:Microsomal glutathione S-transferase 3 [Valsa mali var. pyri (nom. inval.)]